MKEFNDEYLGQEFNDLHDTSGDLAKRTFDENADPISSTKLRKSKSVVAMKVSTLAALATLGIAISIGGVNISVSGNSSSSTSVYTVTDVSDWVYNDGCVLFSWAWNNTSGKQAFYSIKETNGTSVSTELPNDIDGFLLVRCEKGTTTPDWTLGVGNYSPGRIYHQTKNIDVIKGTLSYECPEWLTSPNNYCPGCN